MLFIDCLDIEKFAIDQLSLEFSEVGQNNAQKKNRHIKVFLFIIDIFLYFFVINIDIIFAITLTEYGIIFILSNKLFKNFSMNLVTK